MSIDRRLLISDSHGACPCLPPDVLGRLLDRVYRPPQPLTALERVTRALVNFWNKLTR
jgi:hypothetical protein